MKQNVPALIAVGLLVLATFIMTWWQVRNDGGSPGK